jgi:hypothetical protein
MLTYSFKADVILTVLHQALLDILTYVDQFKYPPRIF